MSEDLLMLGDKAFKSRLIVGTGKYASLEQNRDAVEASGAEMVTVAIRRFDLGDRDKGHCSTISVRRSTPTCPIPRAAIRRMKRFAPPSSDGKR